MFWSRQNNLRANPVHHGFGPSWVEKKIKNLSMG